MDMQQIDETGRTRDQAERLLALQRAAFERAAAPTLDARRASLTRIERLVLNNADAIAAAISADFGNRSLDETRLAEMVPLLNAIRHTRRHLGAWIRPERRPVAITFQPGSARIHHQPLGVVGIMSPWNYPLYLALGPLVDVLAAGNRALIKPSELTPGFSALLQRLVSEQFSETEVAVVTGGPDVAARFSALPFDHLIFTGSTATGRKVAAAAAANLTPLTLELGGKSPAIVAPDADLARAARSIAFGKFLNAGQTCIAPDYALVPDTRLDAFTERLTASIATAYPTIDGNPDYTAIIGDRHHARLVDAVAEVERAGVRVIRPVAATGHDNTRRIAPTLVIDPPADSLLMQEEIFGPVLPVLTYRGIDEAVATVNAGERPLALYVFTRSGATRADILRRTISGGVTVNGTLSHIAQDELPFGGVGPSGQGAYHGRAGFRRFSHARSVFDVGFVNNFEMFRPPYGSFMRRGVRTLMGKAR